LGNAALVDLEGQSSRKSNWEQETQSIGNHDT